MGKKCIICNASIEEEYGKLQGTILKVRDEHNKNQFFHVCSTCQKDKEWITKANIRAA
ncbi:MAG: hypothetical protein AABX16_05025 [Nanoarchaeota archaeon]